MRRAAFLDRDGTINEEVEYLGDPDHLTLLPGAGEAIRRLNEARVPVLIVSNQAGVGRGYFTEHEVEAVHQRLVERLAEHGAHLDGIYYCPHHPDDNCACRKPRAGLIEQAARDHEIDLESSVVIGDKPSDLAAGQSVGCRTVLVLTGYGARNRNACLHGETPPDHLARDLRDAVRWFLEERSA